MIIIIDSHHIIRFTFLKLALFQTQKTDKDFYAVYLGGVWKRVLNFSTSLLALELPNRGAKR